MGTWIWSHRLVATVGGVILLGLAGASAFVLVGGVDQTTTVRAAGNGPQVVRVALVDRAVGFDVTPDVIEVEPGTHLVLVVVNEGDSVHDLALGGAHIDRLDPGASERIDLGRVTDDIHGRCTVGDHDIAGMTTDVRVV